MLYIIYFKGKHQSKLNEMQVYNNETIDESWMIIKVIVDRIKAKILRKNAIKELWLIEGRV